MTAALTAEQLDVVRAADSERLVYTHRVGYLLDGVLVDQATTVLIGDLIADGVLWQPTLPEPGRNLLVQVSDKGLQLL